MRKKKLMFLSLLAITSIAACGTPTASSSEEPVELSSTVSHAVGEKWTEMTVLHDTIPAGGSFYDSCQPTVIFHDKDGNEHDYTEYKNKVTYSVTDDNGNSYGGGDALPEGEYTAHATVSNREATLTIKVENGNPEVGSEGKGYKTYYKKDFENLSIMKHAACGSLGAGKFPSLGSPKMIVIPVIFKDMDGGKDAYTDEEIDILKKAFFGKAEETSWQSLKSYYYSSSYGNLDIEGEVSDEQYVSKYTQDEAEEAGAAAIVKEAAAWYISKKGLSTKDYDYDGDGFVDGVNIIYKTTKKNKSDGGSEFWWNYTSTTGASPNTAKPTVNRYFFSMYSFVNTAYYANPSIDAHTLVHENGHLIGLNDYYSYDTDSSGASSGAPCGCADMMDMNVGDHNGYSKMLYNWLADDDNSNGLHLMNVDGSSDNFTLHLDSYTDKGDLVVIRNTTDDPWNKTPYDEYLILEYYTPTGVNAGDCEGYGEWTSSMSTTGAHCGPYEKAGLQIFHVDARMAVQTGTYDSSKNITRKGYKYFDPILDADDPIPETDTYNSDGTWMGAPIQLTDNTPSRSSYIDEDGKLAKDGGVREISAILSSGVNGLTSSSYYNLFGVQTNLFGTKEWAEENDYTYRAGSNTYSNFRVREFFMHGDDDLVFNDGSKFNWTISVESQDESGCTLHFVNNAAIK